MGTVTFTLMSQYFSPSQIYAGSCTKFWALHKYVVEKTIGAFRGRAPDNFVEQGGPTNLSINFELFYFLGQQHYVNCSPLFMPPKFV